MKDADRTAAELAGANIIYGLGMLEMEMTISYSQLLMDAEMAEMMLFSMDGIVVNDETLSVDVIMGSARADFLAHMNTFGMYINQSPNSLTALPVTAGMKAPDMESRASLPRRNSATWEPEPPEEACARLGSAQRRRT
ncbi:MAG: trimethylamine methyltransferase family protein [Bilophila wadsworthia]